MGEVEEVGREFVVVEGAADLFDDLHCLCLILFPKYRQELIVDSACALEVSADTVPGLAFGEIDDVRVSCGVADALGVVVSIVSALGIMEVVAPMEKSRCAVLIAHPHRQAACRKGKVDDSVHGIARGEAAGIDPHSFPRLLQGFIVLQIFFIDCLLDYPDIDRTA